MADFEFSQRQTQSQKQVQRLSQNLVYGLKILQMPTKDLRSEIYRVVNENPALEIVSDQNTRQQSGEWEGEEPVKETDELVLPEDKTVEPEIENVVFENIPNFRFQLTCNAHGLFLYRIFVNEEEHDECDESREDGEECPNHASHGFLIGNGDDGFACGVDHGTTDLRLRVHYCTCKESEETQK